jgi:hypothetical protein
MDSESQVRGAGSPQMKYFDELAITWLKDLGKVFIVTKCYWEQYGRVIALYPQLQHLPMVLYNKFRSAVIITVPSPLIYLGHHVHVYCHLSLLCRKVSPMGFFLILKTELYLFRCKKSR